MSDTVQDASTGVWVVITAYKGYDECLHAVFPGDQELEARRFSDNQGYGDVVFIEYGEV